jgi:acetyl-CoA synthetase
LAASTVIYEGIPNYPDAGRCWRIAQDLDVNIFHTAPTAIRALRKIGPDEPPKYNYKFKHMTTVGEPIEPEVWKWYYEVVGKGEAAIVDTWWQTETGGFLCSTLPGIKPMKPGSAGPGMPGIHPIIFDEDGNEIPAGAGQAGNICIQNPWPGGFQTIWGDRDRYVKNYYERYCKDPKSKRWQDWPYLTGDAAVQAEDSYYRILGRIDDVINVSGHRLGTKEIESAALVAEEVAEAAVVPVKHDIKGKEPDLYVALKPGYEASDELAAKISKAIVTEIGAIARPRKVWIVSDMPKTRSGKIMRRVLGAISNNNDVGDVMTLANPEIVEEITKMVRSKD